MATKEVPKFVIEAVTNLTNLASALGPTTSQLWLDAWSFLVDSKIERSRRVAPRRERLMRAAVLMAAAAFEGCTNFLADQIAGAGEAAGKRLTEAEVDCLRERRKVLEKGKVRDKKQVYSSKDRFLLLCDLLGNGEELDAAVRARLDKSFDVRDQLVHPKPGVHIDLLADRIGYKAFLGFMIADVYLARVWTASKGATSG